MDQQLQHFQSEIRHELDQILAFWLTHTIDVKYGGFYGEISHDLKVNETANKGLVLYGRILWTFATAYRFYGKQDHLQAAKRAYDYLAAHFLDEEYGGYFWLLDYQGNPVQDRKQVYGQAFAIYAFSEYYRATGDMESLQRAKELFELMEQHTYDRQQDGYYEAFARDWGTLEDMRLSEKDMNVPKSMNTHLHILEAYTNLLRVWDSESLRTKLRQLIDTILTHIVDAKTGHFILFFDEAWNSKSQIISYGHDIEGSWLLMEAAEVLGEQDTIDKVRPIAVKMAEVTLAEGVDDDGGIFNEIHDNGHLDTDKHWWPQAEAVVGFLNAYQMTGRKTFLDASLKTWRFTADHVIDQGNGEWFWKVSRSGERDFTLPKVGQWKCPYHNSRCCFEVLERLETLQHKSERSYERGGREA